MTDAELKVGGLTPMTTIDFPGELAAVVFCQGCPWRCHYCHNPELLPRQGKDPIHWQWLLGFLESRRGLLDAVVFSGGEPTLQQALPTAVDQVKALGFKVGLHTAGIYPQRLATLLPRLDWVGLDIKALADRYPSLTGVPQSGERAWESAKKLIESGVDHEIRTTYHHGLFPADELEQIGYRLNQLGVQKHILQSCNPPPASPLDRVMQATVIP